MTNETLHQVRENAPIQAELRSLVEPLAENLAEQITNEAQQGDVVTQWPGQAEDTITTGLPYGDGLLDDIYMLPPTFFGDTTEIPSELPKDWASIKDYVDDFIDRHANSTTGLIGDTEELRRMLPGLLLSMRGKRIDPEKWERIRQTAQQQQQERRYTLEIVSVQRRLSVLGLSDQDYNARLVEESATGEFGSYIYRTSRTLRRHDGSIAPFPTGILMLPVGEYGEELAIKLLQTTLYTIELAESTLPHLAADIAEGHEKTIQMYTARGRNRHGNHPRTAPEALVESTQEGALSISQTLALMTAEKIEGYEDGVDLIRDITDAGLIRQFAKAVPMGLVGPLIAAGRYFPGLIVKKQGSLELNPQVINRIQVAQKEQIAKAAARWAVRAEEMASGGNSKIFPAVIGQFCPAAFPGGAIEKLGRAMTKAIDVMVET